MPSSECYCAARIVFSVDLALWFIRSLDIFAAIKRLGPKLVMIGEMVNNLIDFYCLFNIFLLKVHDLKFFMLMLTVFILAFGVSSYSLIYGIQKPSWHLPRDIINLAYWQIFGELNALETFERNRRNLNNNIYFFFSLR
jgi:transient receptor potential cation channel subfamily M protein 2